MGLIYKATNLLNGDRYIGRTSQKMPGRSGGHAHTARWGRRKDRFSRALVKYGMEMFRFRVIKFCDSYEELLAEEKRLIELLQPEYNTKRGASGSRPVRNWMPPRLPDDWVLPGEEWRDITKFESYYQVSNLGRVRSLPRKKKTKKGTLMETRGRILKQTMRHYHWAVYLCRGGRKTNCNVHQLVAVAFIGARPAGMGVLHRNDDRDNNRVTNLYYGTQFQNMQDRSINGGTARGERNGRTPLTEADVMEIVRLRPSMSLHALAKQFGVSHTSIEQILGGFSWRHVTGLEPIGRFARKENLSSAATRPEMSH